MILEPIADSPIESDSARVKNISCSVSISQTARAPINLSLLTATSIRAMSRTTPSIIISTSLLGVVIESTSTLPDDIIPATKPATVPSIIYGNTLLVPVEIGIKGNWPEPLATALLVPSPPNVIMQETPNLAIASPARVESFSSSDNRISRKSILRSSDVFCAAAYESLPLSGIITTCLAGDAPNPDKTRFNIFTFS